jgi:PhnB protein
MAIKGASASCGSVTPHLIVRDSREAVEFYKRAFGAVELYSSPLPMGSGMHFHLRINNTFVMVTDEMPADMVDDQAEENIDSQVVLRSPQTLGGATMLLELLVEDVDESYKRAVDAGAVPTLPVSDQFWGDRYGWITDPFGHIWAIATIKEELTPEQVNERMVQFMTETRHGCA